MDLQLHDRVELKKPHPCGSSQWEILRVGMDIKLRCLGCGHELMLPRSGKERPKDIDEGGDYMNQKLKRAVALLLAVVLVVALLASMILPYIG